MKTLKINTSTHTRLATLKARAGDKSLDETISKILDWYDWWVLPGSGRSKGDGNK